MPFSQLLRCVSVVCLALTTRMNAADIRATGDKAPALPDGSGSDVAASLTYFELVKQHSSNRLFGGWELCDHPAHSEGPAMFDARLGTAYQLQVDLSFLLSLFSR